MDSKSTAMHGMKGIASPGQRAPGTPGFGPIRSDPIGAREEVSRQRAIMAVKPCISFLLSPCCLRAVAAAFFSHVDRAKFDNSAG